MYVMFEPVLLDRVYNPRDFNSVETAMQIATQTVRYLSKKLICFSMYARSL